MNLSLNKPFNINNSGIFLPFLDCMTFFTLILVLLTLYEPKVSLKLNTWMKKKMQPETFLAFIFLFGFRSF